MLRASRHLRAHTRFEGAISKSNSSPSQVDHQWDLLPDLWATPSAGREASNFTSWYRGANAAAGAVQRILHPVHLTAAKHDHGCIFDIILKVQEHIAVWAIHAAHRRKFRLAVIRTTLIGVSATKSSPEHPSPSSPQIWRRFSQRPIHTA